MKKLLFVAIAITVVLALMFSAIGCEGSIGPQGPQGSPGPQGVKGEKGARGPEGDQGDIGLQGEEGDKGERGAKGKQGDDGPRGYTGARGLKGDTGEQGLPGPQGEQGIQGEKGDKGDFGDKGDPGMFPYSMQMGTCEITAPIRSYTGIAREISFLTAFDNPPLVFLNIKHTFQPTYLIDVVSQDMGAQEIGTGGFTVVLLNPGDVGGTFTVNWLAISEE